MSKLPSAFQKIISRTLENRRTRRYTEQEKKELAEKGRRMLREYLQYRKLWLEKQELKDFKR